MIDKLLWDRLSSYLDFYFVKKQTAYYHFKWHVDSVLKDLRSKLQIFYQLPLNKWPLSEYGQTLSPSKTRNFSSIFSSTMLFLFCDSHQACRKECRGYPQPNTDHNVRYRRYSCKSNGSQLNPQIPWESPGWPA